MGVGNVGNNGGYIGYKTTMNTVGAYVRQSGLFAEMSGLSYEDAQALAEQQKKAEEEKKAEDKQAEALKRRQQLEQEQAKREQELKMMQEELKASKEEAEAMADSFKVFSKCLTIATRITHGDIVPLKDIKYLAENEPELYKQAIMLRMPNDKPKKYKSVLEDEDESSDETQENGMPDSGSDSVSETQSASEVIASGDSPAAEFANSDTGGSSEQ